MKTTLLILALLSASLSARAQSPIPLATPAPAPKPPIVAAASLPAAAVQSALTTVPATPQSLTALLAQFVALPPGVALPQIRAVTINFAPDGSATIRVQYTPSY